MGALHDGTDMKQWPCVHQKPCSLAALCEPIVCHRKLAWQDRKLSGSAGIILEVCPFKMIPAPHCSRGALQHTLWAWSKMRDVTDTRRVQSKTKGVGNFSWNGVNTKNTWRSKTRLRLRNVLWNVETNSPFLSCWSLVLTYVKARAIDFECFVCSSSGQVCDWAFNETACRCAEQARASRLSRPRTSSPIVGFFEKSTQQFLHFVVQWLTCFTAEGYRMFLEALA